MSTIKSSAENLTLNADGSGNDISMQSNAAEKLKLTAEGNLHLQGSDSRIQLNAQGGANVVGNNTVHIRGDAAHMKLMTASGGNYIFEVNGTEELRVQSGGGISFNGDTAAANALYDYEVGSGTPVAKQGSTTITLAAGATQHYVKVGSLVTFLFEFQISNLNSGSGNYTLNLPFTMMSSGYATGSVRIYNGEVVGNEFIAILSGDSTLHFKRNRNGATTDSINPTVAGYYFGSISYRTAS